MIKMVWEDDSNSGSGALKEGVFIANSKRCIYTSRRGPKLWFRLIRPETAPQLFIDNNAAHAAFRSSFDLDSSSSTCCLSPTSSLDSAIEEGSHTFNMMMIMLKQT